MIDDDEVALLPAVVLAIVRGDPHEAVAVTFDDVEPGFAGMAVNRLRLAGANWIITCVRPDAWLPIERSLRNFVRVPRGVARISCSSYGVWMRPERRFFVSVSTRRSRRA